VRSFAFSGPYEDSGPELWAAVQKNFYDDSGTYFQLKFDNCEAGTKTKKCDVLLTTVLQQGAKPAKYFFGSLRLHSEQGGPSFSTRTVSSSKWSLELVQEHVEDRSISRMVASTHHLMYNYRLGLLQTIRNSGFCHYTADESVQDSLKSFYGREMQKDDFTDLKWMQDVDFLKDSPHSIAQVFKSSILKKQKVQSQTIEEIVRQGLLRSNPSTETSDYVREWMETEIKKVDNIRKYQGKKKKDKHDTKVTLIDFSGDCDYGVKLRWETMAPAKVGFGNRNFAFGIEYDKKMKLIKVSTWCGAMFCGVAWLREWDVVYYNCGAKLPHGWMKSSKGDDSERNQQQEELAGFIGCIYDQLMLWQFKGNDDADASYSKQRDELWSAWFNKKMPKTKPSVIIDDDNGKVYIGDKSYEVAEILTNSAPHAAVKDTSEESWVNDAMRMWIIRAFDKGRDEEDPDADEQHHKFARFLGIAGAKPLGTVSQKPSELTLSCRNERDGAPKVYVAVLLQHLSLGSRITHNGDLHRLLEKSAVQMSEAFHIPPIRMEFSHLGEPFEEVFFEQHVYLLSDLRIEDTSSKSIDQAQDGLKSQTHYMNILQAIVGHSMPLPICVRDQTCADVNAALELDFQSSDLGRIIEEVRKETYGNHILEQLVNSNLLTDHAQHGSPKQVLKNEGLNTESAKRTLQMLLQCSCAVASANKYVNVDRYNTLFSEASVCKICMGCSGTSFTKSDFYTGAWLRSPHDGHFIDWLLAYGDLLPEPVKPAVEQ